MVLPEPLPFQPEPLQDLQARLSQALDHVLNIEEEIDRLVRGGGAAGYERRHCFDREDGLRLIVTVETSKLLEDRTYLHVSMGIGACHEHWASVMREALDSEEGLQEACVVFGKAVQELFARYPFLKLWNTEPSPKGIHFWFYWPSETIH